MTAVDGFVPHKNAPGPPRLDMAVADSSGTVNVDPMFVADRLAIAYSYLIDEARWDEWFRLSPTTLSLRRRRRKWAR